MTRTAPTSIAPTSIAPTSIAPTTIAPTPSSSAAQSLVAAPQEHGHDLVEVRAWARSRGYPVDECSGVPLQVLRTYQRVHAA